MINLNKCLLVCLFLVFASPILAQHEVHVVAVGEGYRTDDFYALPEARVFVNRPGQEIILVLLDDGELHWKVEASAGTIISEIVRSGPDTDASEVSLFGVPVVGVQFSGLPLVFRPMGRDFRSFVDSLADRLRTERISSFHGVQKQNDSPVVVDRVNTTTAGLARDYLSRRLETSDDLPLKIRRWVETGDSIEEFVVDFDEAGVSLTGPNGTQRFPATANIPRILLPVLGVYDPVSQMIYCATYGAEGYIYSVDVRTGEWGVVTSLDGYDAAGLLFDPDSGQLITSGAFSRPGDIRVFGLDGSRSSVFIPTKAFPGLTDLFNYGNEHGPPLIPRAFSEGWLLLEAFVGREGARSNSGQYRIYAVMIETGEVRLLRFGNN